MTAAIQCDMIGGSVLLQLHDSIDRMITGTAMKAMKKPYDICIIGAGASGLAAALEAADAARGARILLIEKNDAPGRKIRATGNGRCNISNIWAEDAEIAQAFFRKWGIVTRTYPGGLIYPYSESAADVTELLMRQVEASEIELWMNATVTEIEPHVTEREESTGDNFGRKEFVQEESERVECEREEQLHEETGCAAERKSGERMDDSAGAFSIQIEDHGKKHSISAQTVILSTGGKAGPQYGTIGEGYRFLRKLGHTVRSTIPVLTPVDCAEDDCRNLAGTRAKGRIRLSRKSPEEWMDIFSEEGEIQFTSYGISGICVFNMTRHMRFDRDEGLQVFRITIDLCPDLDVRSFLQEQRAAARKGDRNVSAADGMASLLRKKLVKTVFHRANVSEDTLLAELPDEAVEALAQNIHELIFRPTGVHGWKEAQCTSGGVLPNELDSKTGESRICPGLYVTGELQDYDGPCGGYNLNHAWNTGAAAGRAAATRIRRQ